MNERLKDVGIFLIAVSLSLTGCATPFAKQLANQNSFMGNSSLGVSSQFMDEDQMVLSLTIPLK